VADSSSSKNSNALTRALHLLRPSHQHSAFSATVLLMVMVMLSRIIGYARELYIAWAFGANKMTDAYNAGFTIPDWVNYLVAGGTASITFVSIYSRFLAEKREADAQKTFSIIITVMTSIMAVGIILAEVFTPQLNRWMFGGANGFNEEQLLLCNQLTRILLPAQIFFYVGGVVAAVLLTHRRFLLPALGPLVYNLFIIAGGVLLGHRFGIASLAYGAVAGALVGIFLISAVGAARTGIGYRISFDVRNPAFREWVRLSIPLMVGVSLVSADDWILRHFASGSTGAISHLNYAKRLFLVPIAVLGQAAGQASFPFFARLYGEKKFQEYAKTVNDSVSRLAALSILASGFMISAALPLIDLAYRRGQFSFADSQVTALYFAWFSISLAMWAAQSLYARAYYASGNTLVPMVATTAIFAASLPMYASLHRALGTTGLAIASDIGISANCIAIAYLLHRRGLVPFRGLHWAELGKTVVVAALATGLAFKVSSLVAITGKRSADVQSLTLSLLTFGAAVAVGLWLTRSRLLDDLRRRKAATYSRAVEEQSQTSGAGVES
jgi:putative peptidoglycan lipid II flippase